MPLIKIAPVYKTINPMEVPVKKSITRTINADSGESALDLEEQIRCRAYELYERREREDGHEVEDWLQAEAEIAREKTKPLEVEPVKSNRIPPVTKTGKSKTKQLKQVEIIGAIEDGGGGKWPLRLSMSPSKNG
jgi:hypothetical protein